MIPNTHRGRWKAQYSPNDVSLTALLQSLTRAITADLQPLGVTVNEHHQSG
jgi:hypothetical protein